MCIRFAGVFALACSMFAPSAQAQGAPQSGATQLIGEFSKDVSTGGFGGKSSWKGYVPLQATVQRASSGEWLIATQDGLSVRMDSASFHQHRTGAGNSEAQNLRYTSTRAAGDLKEGMGWSGQMDADFPPAAWCKEAHSVTVSNFEVEPAEKYEVVVDGNPRSVTVLPVVERGTWNRCYTGKRFTRTLYSPELGVPVAIEHVGYTPTGQVHGSSYRINVKELRR